MSEFSESVLIDAPPERVWEILADIGSIARWNPGVRHSEQTIAGDAGLGAGRRCDLGGKNYLDEEVVTFQPISDITFRIVGTNLPFASADIRFHLEPVARHTQVSVSPVYALKFGYLGRVLDALVVGRVYRKGMRDLLQGLKADAENHN